MEPDCNQILSIDLDPRKIQPFGLKSIGNCEYNQNPLDL